MQCEKCDSSLLRSLSLLPDHVKGFDALRASRLLRPIDTSDELGQTRRGGERNVAVVADQAREPAPACHVTWWPDRGLGVVGRRRRRRGVSHARGHRLAGSAALNREALGGDPWVRAEYAEGQPWTRDPRGPRVQDHSPRIPHGKVTKWQSISISPCQGVIIG